MIRTELQEDLKSVASAAGFEPALDLLLNEAQECAYILNDIGRPGSSRHVAESRFGGLPDLPENVEWPRGWDTEGWVSGFARFFAQFNLQDLPVLAGLEIPRTGLLSLFARRWQFTQETFVAIYSPDVTELRTCSVAPVGGVDEDERPAWITPIRFERGFSLPFHRRTFRDSLENHVYNEVNSERLLRLVDKVGRVGQVGGYSIDAEVDICRRIALSHLGHADYESADRFLSLAEYESELQLYSGEGRLARLRPKVEWIEQNRAQIEAEASSWRLLFRLGQNLDHDFGIGDALSLDIFIRSSDLAAGRFDNLWGEMPQTL